MTNTGLIALALLVVGAFAFFVFAAKQPHWQVVTARTEPDEDES